MRWVDDIINFEQTLGDGEGQGNLECCNPWGHKELNTTEQQPPEKHPDLDLKSKNLPRSTPPCWWHLQTTGLPLLP